MVWIASAPDTAFKLRDKLKDTGKVFQDRLCNLNSVAETKQIVRECEAQGLDLQEVPSDQIVGVAVVEPAFAWDALRELSSEERVQFDFFQALHAADCDLHGLLIFFCSPSPAHFARKYAGAACRSAQITELLRSNARRAVAKATRLVGGFKGGCAALAC